MTITLIERIAHKLRPAAAANKTELFPTKRPPRADSFMRWLGGMSTAAAQHSAPYLPMMLLCCG